MGNIFGYHCDRHQNAELENDINDNKKLAKNASVANYNSNKIETNLQNPLTSQQNENILPYREEESKDPILEKCDEPQNNYEQELKPYTVRNFSLKKSKEDFDHHYNPTIKTSNSSNFSCKTPRLANEIKLLSKSLPVKLSNSIFIVYDESRMDVMKAAIIGADDTPYANGVFIYDIYCDENFPASPPKMNLMTTGNNKIRFNPNLYSNGYICLSLLGTWSGDSIEKWTVNSNLLQILLSIQSIVMSEGVIYNEPGHQRDNLTETGRARNQGYSNIVKYANIKYAMISHLKSPPACFKNVIQNHFRLKKDAIIEACEKWITEEKNSTIVAQYDGLVELHNKELASKYKLDSKKFLEDLIEEVEELKKELNKLNK